MVEKSKIRTSPEMRKLIDSIRIDFIKKGKKPPSISDITRVIASKIKKEEILYDQFIQFR